MHLERVRPALRERLGHEATADFVDCLGHCQKEWQGDVISLASERFERRLSEETSKLRLEMVFGFASVRRGLAEGLAAMRQETTREISREVGALRKDMTEGFAGIRQDMAGQRAEIIKWAFLFWIGQFFAVAGLFAALARYLRVP